MSDPFEDLNDWLASDTSQGGPCLTPADIATSDAERLADALTAEAEAYQMVKEAEGVLGLANAYWEATCTHLRLLTSKTTATEWLRKEGVLPS